MASVKEFDLRDHDQMHEWLDAISTCKPGAVIITSAGTQIYVEETFEDLLEKLGQPIDMLPAFLLIGVISASASLDGMVYVMEPPMRRVLSSRIIEGITPGDDPHYR